jgi:DNA primase
MKTPRTGDDWVERVRAATDIVELIGHTVVLKRQGRNWVGRCPFHEEKTPSFAVNPERQFYHCFGCKKGGDVFKFVQETDKVGFLEAAERLSRRAGIAVPERRPGEARERGAKARVLDALERAAAVYEQWLGDPARGAAGRAALEARGVDHETRRAFRLGLALPGWENLVQRLRGEFPDEVLIAAGLAARRERGGLYDRFRHRLMIPLGDGQGAVVGFGARSLAPEDTPKYLNSPESPVYHKGAYMFGLGQARRAAEAAGEIVVVEGYFDVLALHQAGVANAVAASGTALTAEHARTLGRLVRRVVLTFDGDAAGQSAMLRSLGVLIAEGLEVRVTDLPPGTDPDELVRHGGQPAWDAARAAAADPASFVQRHVLRSGAGDPRERALHALADLAAAAREPLMREGLVRRADEVFGVELAGFREALGRALTLRARGERIERPIAALVERQRAGESFVERKLLALLLQHPGGLARVRAHVSPEDFRDSACAALALWLWGGRAGEPPEDVAALARELEVASTEVPDWEGELDVGTRLIASRRLRRELRQRRERLAGVHDPCELEQLQREIEEIGRSLKSLGV